MKFVKSIHAAASLGGIMLPKDLDTQSPSSIRSVAATIAHDTMAYYKGNNSAPGSYDVGNVPKPYYWWIAGALWGAMLDYYHFTQDPSYNNVVIQALTSPPNIATTFNYMPKEHELEEGNDDLFFWGSAVMSAAERNFPQPNKDVPSWLDISTNVFNSLASRWDTQNCGGGLLWQIFPENPNGMTYKNSISNGGFFQLAARLARATGNETYVEWAQKVWDWSVQNGVVDSQKFRVFDGVDIRTACKEVNKVSFTYTSGIYMYGAAVMANHTGKPEWSDRAEKLLGGADWFFSKDEKTKNIMFEASCETVDKCNFDMTTFKGYMSRFMWQTAMMQPSLRPQIETYLIPSAKAAVATCTGGENGHQCGMKWFTGGFDNKPGLGPQMCALEVVQGLLSGSSQAPLKGNDIKLVRETDFKPVDA